jgi:hypothetical protein
MPKYPERRTINEVCLETLGRTVDLRRNMKMREVPESLRER